MNPKLEIEIRNKIRLSEEEMAETESALRHFLF